MPGFDSDSLYFVWEKQNLEGTGNEVCIPRAIGAARLHSSSASGRRAHDARNQELIKVLSICRDPELVIYTARRRNEEWRKQVRLRSTFDVKHVSPRICWISLRDKQKREVRKLQVRSKLNKVTVQHVKLVNQFIS